MARGGMRIGEVLKLRPMDADGRKLILENPKSGREAEAVFIPQKVAERLRQYIRHKAIDPTSRIFPISHAAASPAAPWLAAADVPGLAAYYPQHAA